MLQNNPTNAQKLLPIISVCGWLGLNWFSTREISHFFQVPHLAPVTGKPISANRGLNGLNLGIKFIPRLVSVPELPISTIQGINKG